jgi:hypothetical protein
MMMDSVEKKLIFSIISATEFSFETCDVKKDTPIANSETFSLHFCVIDANTQCMKKSL